MRIAYRPEPRTGWVAGILAEDTRQTRRQSVRGVRRTIPSDPHRAPSERLLAAWAPVAERVQDAVPEAAWGCWLSVLHPHRLVGGVWVVGCPAQTVVWVQARFSRVLGECAGEVVFAACEGIS